MNTGAGLWIQKKNLETLFHYISV